MKRRIHRLSRSTVQRLVRPGAYCDGGGLYLQVSHARTRSWIFRYTRNGKAHEMGLGPEYDVSLDEARQEAKACRLMLVKGIDPLARKEVARLTHALYGEAVRVMHAALMRWLKKNKALDADIVGKLAHQFGGTRRIPRELVEARRIWILLKRLINERSDQ